MKPYWTGLLTVALLCAGTSLAAWDCAGTYDEQVVNMNTVDVEASGNSLSLADFKSAVSDAFAAGRGGVLAAGLDGGFGDSAASSHGSNGTLLKANYASGTKTLLITPDVSIEINEDTGVKQAQGLSLDGYLQKDDAGRSITLSLSVVDADGNAMPDEVVTELGVTLLSRSTFHADGIEATVTAAYSDGTTSVSVENIGNVAGTDDTFFYFAAPAGESISSLRIQATDNLVGTNQDRIPFDDLAFITNSGLVADSSVLTMDSVLTTVDLLPQELLATVTGNTGPITSATFTLLADDVDFPEGAEGAYLTVTDVADLGDGFDPSLSTVLITDVAGTYKVQLVVSDGTGEEDGILEAIAEIVVAADDCQATKDAGLFDPNKFDFNEDCHVNLPDVAMFAAAWMNDTTIDEPVAVRDIPNIVVIIADDLAWADVGYNGQQYFETPHIDQLATDGMRFNHAYSGASVCSPSRACLISGMYSPRHSIYHPGNRARGNLEWMLLAVPNREVYNDTYDWFAAIGDLEPGVNSLAKVLNPAGYVTARYGKWHVGSDEQGFDISEDVADGYSISYGTEELTDGGIEFIRENKDQPFFLYLSYYDVHKPFTAYQDVIDKYQAKKDLTGGDFSPTYAAMVEAVDTGVGRVRAELSDLGIADNTLFIFTSDNGGFPDITSNLPLYGYKGTLYEGGIRIPTCMVWPRRITPGSTCDTPITSVDYLPTFADIARTSLADSTYPVDGVSMLPLMEGKSIDERAIFWHFPLYANIDHSAADGTFPVFGTDHLYWRGVPATVIRRGNYKLLYYYEDQSVKLFDVVNDIGETTDLSEEQPEIAAQLLAELQAWTTAVDAPTPEALNPLFDPPSD